MRLARNMEFIDLLHSRLIDEEYTKHPFYGTRTMVVFLKTAGHVVNRKRVQRLMREMAGSFGLGVEHESPAKLVSGYNLLTLSIS